MSLDDEIDDSKESHLELGNVFDDLYDRQPEDEEQPSKNPFVRIARCVFGKFFNIFLYSSEFSFSQRTDLMMNKVPSVTANKYKEYKKTRFNYDETSMFIANDVPLEDAVRFPERFDVDDVIEFVKSGTQLEKILKYDPVFSGSDISYLEKFNVPNEIAIKYKEKHGFDGKTISLLYILDMPSSKIKSKKHEKLLESIKNSSFYASQIKKGHGKPNLLGVGAYSFVLSWGKNAWKFGKILDNEISLHEKLQKSKTNKLQNIVNFIGCSDYEYSSNSVFAIGEWMYNIIQLEQIPGDSLENVLKEKQKLPVDKVLRYGAGIMNGLVEMRTAGIIHHRDIKPKNIIIDEKRDEAVIVDLGVATTERWPTEHVKCISDYNKAYGTHDLVSLAQVMYKMATGEHLFSESETMELTKIKYPIRDEREQVYQDPKNRLKPYFKKIDDKVADERVNKLIKHCLNAKPYHFRKTQRMFEGCLE